MLSCFLVIAFTSSIVQEISGREFIDQNICQFYSNVSIYIWTLITLPQLFQFANKNEKEMPPVCIKFDIHPQPLSCCHFLLCPPLISHPPPFQVIIAQSLIEFAARLKKYFPWLYWTVHSKLKIREQYTVFRLKQALEICFQCAFNALSMILLLYYCLQEINFK